MKLAEQIVFRRLTAADFYNINKPKGSEARGGGQSYIDFPTSAVTPGDWAKFFAGLTVSKSLSGPLWKFTVSSVGLGKSQIAEIGQRRKASYNIRSQKLGTSRSSRLFAWHPQYGFPAPANPNKRASIQDLVVYLIRTTGGEFWANWFQAKAPQPGWSVDDRLRPMFTRDDGNIYLDPGVNFDEADGRWPFQNATIPQAPRRAAERPAPAQSKAKAQTGRTQATRKQSLRYRQKSEEQVVDELFSDDVSPEPESKDAWQTVRRVLKRNERAVDSLKALYGGECQLTGNKYVFEKPDGRLYCEAHHLIPLGEGGADLPHNLIIVSPLIHRMFHYAVVTGLDLSKIVDDKLEIEINGERFTIKWHPKHAERVTAAAKNAVAQVPTAGE